MMVPSGGLHRQRSVNDRAVSICLEITLQSHFLAETAQDLPGCVLGAHA